MRRDLRRNVPSFSLNIPPPRVLAAVRVAEEGTPEYNAAASCVTFEADEIFKDVLYLGRGDNLYNERGIEEKGITAVINMADNVILPRYITSGKFNLLHLPIPDKSSINIS